jgi:hypothetical protein
MINSKQLAQFAGGGTLGERFPASNSKQHPGRLFGRPFAFFSLAHRGMASKLLP